MNWRADIEAAAGRIAGHVVRTPVMQAQGFGLDRTIQMKLEQVQHTGSFKVRGAFNTMLSGEAPRAGYVAASGGNHGAAVAFSAHALGRQAQIFVPELAGAAKISLIERTGAGLTVVPGAYADALAAALAHEKATGAQQIHAYDTPPTVAGQGTLLREWEEQGLEADTVLIAVGGGGLIAGALAWSQARYRVVAVEPERSRALNAALAGGGPVDVDVAGVAVNALGAKRIGQICYDLSVAHNALSVTVPDDAIITAQRALWQEHRLLVEPAGATALAALMSGAYRPQPDERVAVLVCGANPDPDPLG